MRIPLNDILLMFTSTLLALLLWFWMGSEERAEIIVSVPLEYRNVPRDMEISSQGELVSKVNLAVKGSTANIKDLQAENVSVWLDLAGVKPGERSVELTTENVKVPYGFTVLRISPSRVQLKVEQITRKLVPVVARLEGKSQYGLTVNETTISPAQVEVIGPRSAVNTVKRVQTDTIDVSELTGNYTQRVKIGIENNAVRLGNTREVTVALQMSEVLDQLTLRGVQVRPKGTSRVVRFQPKTVRVDFEATKSLLAEINSEEVQAILDLEGLPPGVYDVTPRISYPGQSPKVFVKNVLPPRIHVRIQ